MRYNFFKFERDYLETLCVFSLLVLSTPKVVFEDLKIEGLAQ